MIFTPSDFREFPVTFTCENEQLMGIVHQPANVCSQGVLVVVGGPQYRVGSHRQFVLLARYLAANGIAVMRFDYRGMGDAEGDSRSFETIDADIQAAVYCFYQYCPNLSGVLLLGLCDAASASLFYGYKDQRINGLVLLNPWVFTEQGSAKTYLKHYYWRKLWSSSLWRKILTLKFNYAESLESILNMLVSLLSRLFTQKNQCLSLPQRMCECWQRFQYPILLILSGRDLTASEFKEVIQGDPAWQRKLNDPRVTRYDLAAADHTFSSQQWRDQVAGWILDWINSKFLNIVQTK